MNNPIRPNDFVIPRRPSTKQRDSVDGGGGRPAGGSNRPAPLRHPRGFRRRRQGCGREGNKTPSRPHPAAHSAFSPTTPAAPRTPPHGPRQRRPTCAGPRTGLAAAGVPRRGPQSATISALFRTQNTENATLFTKTPIFEDGIRKSRHPSTKPALSEDGRAKSDRNKTTQRCGIKRNDYLCTVPCGLSGENAVRSRTKSPPLQV